MADQSPFRNRKHCFETTVAGGDFRSDRTAGGHQVYQPGDVHKTRGMYFLTSQNEKYPCVKNPCVVVTQSLSRGMW